MEESEATQESTQVNTNVDLDFVQIPYSHEDSTNPSVTQDDALERQDLKTIPKPVYPRGRAYVYERMNVPFTFDETQTLPARYTSTFEPFHDDAGLSDDCLMQEIERFLSSVGDAIIPSGLLDQPISTAPDATNPGKSSQLRQLEVQEASHSKKMPEQRRLAQESTISNDWLEIAQSRAPDAVDVDDQSRERFVPSESLHRSWNFTEQPLLRPSDVTSASDLVGDPIDGSNGNNVGNYVEPSSSSGQDTLPYDDTVAHVSLLAQVDQYLPTSARFVPNDHLSQHAREIVPGVSSTASKAELKWFNEHRCSRTQKLQEEQSANASICREIAGWTDSTDCNDEMNELETFDSKELETLLNTLVENEKLCFIPKLASEQGENIDPHFAHQECTTLERSKGEQPRFVFPAQNPTDETTGADAESEQVESNKPTLGARSVRVSLPVEHSVQDSRVIYYESFDGSFDEGNEAFFTHEAPDLAAEDEPEIPDSALIGPRNTAVLADSTGISNHSAPEATQTPASGASGAVGAGGSGNAGTPLVTDNQDPEIPDVSSPLPPMDNNLADPRGDSGSSSSIGPYMDTPGGSPYSAIFVYPASEEDDLFGPPLHQPDAGPHSSSSDPLAADPTNREGDLPRAATPTTEHGVAATPAAEGSGPPTAVKRKASASLEGEGEPKRRRTTGGLRLPGEGSEK